jgi:lipopolysaccharide heptosyltransferase II
MTHDRDALARRNRYVAEAFHAPSLREGMRGHLLRSAARLPITQLPGNTQRLLLIRPDHLGDLLLTLPALESLRAAHPSHEIHMLVGGWAADVLAPIAAVDAVLTLPFPGFTRTEERTSPLAPYLLAYKASRMLRRIGYDDAYILRHDHWWGALVAFLAGIPRRIGWQDDDTTAFLTEARTNRPVHAAIANWRLVQPTGEARSPSYTATPPYPVSDDARAHLDALLAGRGVEPDDPCIAVHVGSGAAIKNWRIESWARVADALCDGLNAVALLTGSAGERQTAEQIASAMKGRALILAGETDLPALAAALARAKIVLGADSGPMHLAAAIGTPTVTLFGAADPDEFRPWGNPQQHRIVTSDIACRPCRILDWRGDDPSFHPCVRDITPAQVIDAAWRALNAANPG